MGIRITGYQWPALERSAARRLRRAVDRRRQALAAGAIEQVVHECVRYIRAMADRREALCGEVFPGSDYHQQIAELAGLSITLLPGLDPAGPELPSATLQSTWDSRSVPQQQWIRICLAEHDIPIDSVLDPVPPARRRHRPR